MNVPVKALSSVPSCTKTVTIRADGDVIKLKQQREVLVNGEEAVVEPSVWIDGIYIRHASSVFLSGSRFLFFVCPRVKLVITFFFN